jgi:hypothetical protein
MEEEMLQKALRLERKTLKSQNVFIPTLRFE